MIVADSALWGMGYNPMNVPGGYIFTGIVTGVASDENGTTYDVEVRTNEGRTTLSCRQMVKFGDFYNFEEVPITTPLVKGSVVSKFVPSPDNYAQKVGEIVCVAVIGKGFREGIILGGINHPSRKKKGDEGEYLSSFNGLKTSIKKDGSYKIEFQGIDASAISISKVPVTPAFPPSIFVPTIKGSYFTFEKDGSYEVSDASITLAQSIRIDKTLGFISFESGKVSIKMEKLTNKLSVAALDGEMKFTKGLTIKSLDTEISSLKSTKIKSPKIAIGFGSVELIDVIGKLVDAIGAVTPIHPLGPCSPLTASPTWIPVKLLKAQLELIKGSL